MHGAMTTFGHIPANDLTGLGWKVSTVPWLLLPVSVAPCTHSHSHACIQHSSMCERGTLCAT